MRPASVLALCAFASSALAAPIDLDAPGALELLRARNPAHYARVTAIIERTAAHPVPEVATWIRTTFDHADAESVLLWYVSDPPKTRLSFTLDRAEYTIVLVDRFQTPKLIPAR